MRYIISLLLTSVALAGATVLPAHADVPKVVTDIPPVHALVAQVMGNLGAPILLLTRGANGHDFQLRPSQAQDIAGADLIVWIGPEMTPWLDRAIPALAAQTETLPLLAAEQTNRLTYGDADDHDPDGTHDDHDHGHSGIDPHAWLDPDNARAWLALIAAELSRIDPEHGATYTDNANRSAQGIAALDARLTAQLAPIKDAPFVTQHDAYGYLTAHFGLTPVGSVAMGDASAPGAARLQALGRSLRDQGAVCLFPEAQHDPALLTQLAEGSTVRIGGALDPAGSLQDPGPGAYAATLQAIADTLVDCLGANPAP
jgi:zinc transport system substrate-binding protein